MRPWRILHTAGGDEFVPACCRCGFCCITTPCAAARQMWAQCGQPPLGANVPCPFLIMHGQRATCGIADHPAIKASFGAGCCVKARFVLPDASQVGFAQAPDEIKRMVVSNRVHRLRAAARAAVAAVDTPAQGVPA